MNNQFCVAYRNTQTIAHDERTGRQTQGWVRISNWGGFDETKRCWQAKAEGFANTTTVAMFEAERNERQAWFTKEPYASCDGEQGSFNGVMIPVETEG